MQRCELSLARPGGRRVVRRRAHDSDVLRGGDIVSRHEVGQAQQIESPGNFLPRLTQCKPTAHDSFFLAPVAVQIGLLLDEDRVEGLLYGPNRVK